MKNSGIIKKCVSNKINSIGMDGFYIEPITKENNDEYLQLNDSKFIITPHNAYNSTDAVLEMEKMLTESLEDVKDNKEIRNQIV